MQKAILTLDALGDQQFEGYTDGRRWNGWACPAFTHAQATRLIAAWHALDRPAGHDAATNAFWFSSLDEDSTEAAEHFAGVAVDGQTLYPIGTGAWTWDEVPQLVAQPA